MEKSFTIHSLPKAERPRERLGKFGAEALSVQELLALVLGRGSRGESVIVTAQRLLSVFGSLYKLSQASIEELVSIKGIGPAKAAQLGALFELGRRSEQSTDESIRIKSAGDVVKVIQKRLKDKKREHFLILCLNTKNVLIKVSNISIGTLNSGLVHPREVFKEAVSSLAAAIILTHNHPSGDPEPSVADIKLTERLYEAGKIIGIDVLDHVIIGKNKYLSFKEKNIVLTESRSQ